jgi:hypothetical protein
VNQARLKQAEQDFLHQYPGGFENPEFTAIRQKKHNVDRMIAFVQEVFAETNFQRPDQIVESMVKVIGRSSVISVFEKARFRDAAHGLIPPERWQLANGLGELLHRHEQSGFESMLDVLQRHRLGKWSLMTICQTYYHPNRDVLVKPMTVKSILQHYEIDHLQYKPLPTWMFYESYRNTLLEMKSKVDPSLAPTNAAFSWFLLLSVHR